MKQNNSITCIPAKQVVPGRLYYFKGTVVRAGKKASNNLRHVSVHKVLHGFVNDDELFLINKAGVEQYLQIV